MLSSYTPTGGARTEHCRKPSIKPSTTPTQERRLSIAVSVADQQAERGAGTVLCMPTMAEARSATSVGERGSGSERRHRGD